MDAVAIQTGRSSGGGVIHTNPHHTTNHKRKGWDIHSASRASSEKDHEQSTFLKHACPGNSINSNAPKSPKSKKVDCGRMCPSPGEEVLCCTANGKNVQGRKGSTARMLRAVDAASNRRVCRGSVIGFRRSPFYDIPQRDDVIFVSEQCPSSDVA